MATLGALSRILMGPSRWSAGPFLGNAAVLLAFFIYAARRDPDPSVGVLAMGAAWGSGSAQGVREGLPPLHTLRIIMGKP